MTEAIETLVLVRDPGIGLMLERLSDHRSLANARRVVVEVTRDSAAHAMVEARRIHGGVPLGFVAESESAALEAIEQGADEAEVLVDSDAPALMRFIDRVELRAALRQETEQRTRNAAHAEKLAALGTLVAGVGHEINNPLSVLMLSLHAARRTLVPLLNASWELTRLSEREEPIPPQALRQLARTVHRRASAMDAGSLLDEMVAASQSIADVIRDLRMFARTDGDEHAAIIDLEETVEQVLRLMGREIKRVAVVERDYEKEVPKLVLPRSRLIQVITNLVVNATQAMQEIERSVHRLRITWRTDEDFVALSISDTGPGIPLDSLERIFDPFYSTKRGQMGTGLGLSISRSILRSLGGDLIVESVYGDGATFVCLLPRPSAEVMREATYREVPRTPSHMPPSTGVLLVDDDERVLRACSRFLSDRCRIVIARDGQEAIDLLTSGSQVDVVVTELDMTGSDGQDFYHWLLEHRPDLARRTIIATDISGADRSRATLTDGMPVVPKPIKGPALLDAIDRVHLACGPSPASGLHMRIPEPEAASSSST